MSALAVDPVCSMSVERDRAVSGEWQGRTLYFCSRGCRAEFMSDPVRFPAPEPGPATGNGQTTAPSDTDR
jgi:YHS domain-containing protein